MIDADGATLPDAAGKGRHLMALAVAQGSHDPQGATVAMLAVAGSLPADLRAQVTSIGAGTATDVTLQVTDKKGAKRTVVWGGASDADLKAKVVRTLLGKPAAVIDVSSPVAPVTR